MGPRSRNAKVTATNLNGVENALNELTDVSSDLFVLTELHSQLQTKKKLGSLQFRLIINIGYTAEKMMNAGLRCSSAIVIEKEIDF